MKDNSALADCANCPLSYNPVHGRGPTSADVVFVGDAPSREDEKEGRVFSKSAGLLLDATVDDVGGDPRAVFYTNTVLCRSVGQYNTDVPPPASAIKACSKRLNADIKERSPKVVIASGAPAVRTLCETGRPISAIQGAMHWNEACESFVIPTFAPGAVLAGAKDSVHIFDDIYQTLNRAALISRGELALPDKAGQNIPWEFIGHRGEKIPRGEFFTWTGYWDQPTVEEHARASEVISGWIDTLCTGSRTLNLALDTESRDLDFFHPMTMIQLYDGDKAYAFTWGVITSDTVARKLHFVLSHDNTHLIMHNLAHDRKMLKHWLGLDLGERDEDTMVWALGLTEKGREVGLKYQSRQYLNAPFYEENLREWFDPENDPWDMCPPDVLAEYGCADVYNTWKLSNILPRLVVQEGTSNHCKTLLLPAARAFADCEYRGVGVDLKYAKELEEQWVPMVDEAERKLVEYARNQGFPLNPVVTAAKILPLLCPLCCSTNDTVRDATDGRHRKEWRQVFVNITGTDASCAQCKKRRYIMAPDNSLNVRSFKQLAHLAYDILGFTEGKFGRTTDKKFFERNEGHPFVELMQTFRQLDKLLNSFVRAIAKHVKQDGRIHPSFLLFGAVTGRPSIKDPAMQTIPKFGTDPVAAKMIRKLFPAKPGFLIVDFDYANLELFTCWAYSEDPELGKALTEGDYHTSVASSILGVPYDEVTPEQRNGLKPLTFGLAYGMTAWKMAQGPLKAMSGGSEAVCQQYIDGLWAKFPKWKATYDKWRSDAVELGELTSMMGRKRRWKLINSQNEWHVLNQASNFPSQSLASDLCVNSLIELNKLLPARGYGNVLFSVHDSIVSEIRKDKIHEAVKLIEQVMTTPPFESVAQFKVKAEVGPTLGDVVAYDPEKSYV